MTVMSNLVTFLLSLLLLILTFGIYNHNALDGDGHCVLAFICCYGFAKCLNNVRHCTHHQHFQSLLIEI